MNQLHYMIGRSDIFEHLKNTHFLIDILRIEIVAFYFDFRDAARENFDGTSWAAVTSYIDDFF